jgi:signal peptidase I
MAISARDNGNEPPEVNPEGSDRKVNDRGRHARERSDNGAWRGIREFVIIIVIALIISAFVRAFLVQAFYVPSSSMEMTLVPNDRIVASRITTRIAGVDRGEVLVFRDPGGWLPEPGPAPDGVRGAVNSALTFIGLLPSDSGSDLVKRVIGIGGDTVACCDVEGRIVLNGVPLDESYVQGPTDQVRFDVVVPPDSMFVMGDNRGDSRDSRYHLDVDGGAVPTSSAVGRVMLVVWPFENFGILSIPSIFANRAIDAGS